MPKFPSRISFWCEVPASSGGATPLLLSHQVYKAVSASHPEFVKELEAKGLKYTRVLPDGDDNTSAIGRGWQSTYGTSDKEEAVAKHRAHGGEAEWLPDGSLKTVTAVLPAVRPDPKGGKPQWFNSMVAAYTGWKVRH